MRRLQRLGHRWPIESALTFAGAWSPRRHSAWWAAAALIIGAAGSAVIVGVLIHAPDAQPDFRDGLESALTYVVPYSIAGAFLIHRRPDLPFGWLLAGAAVAVAVGMATAGEAYLSVRRGDTAALTQWAPTMGAVGPLPVLIQGLVNVRFPSGRPSSRPGRVLEIGLIVGIGVALLGGVLSGSAAKVVRTDGTTTQVRNPLTGGTELGRIATDLTVAVPVVILLGLVAGLGVVRRAWKATGIERDQLRWRAFGVVLALCLFPLAVSEVLPALVSGLDGVLFVTTMAIPVVRYRLWAIDTIIRRSVIYAVAVAVLTAAFAGIAVVVAMLVSERVGFVVAAAVTAVAFAPALSRSQRVVDRLFYGDRSDPYRALSDVARRLDGAGAPGEVLQAVVTAVADSLRLPYVSIERPVDGLSLASHGDASLAGGAGVERWPLAYRGATVGVLTASPRRGDAVFDARDRVVLSDIARQSGAAVHAEALTVDLLDSRQRLVSVIAEERRRLRRDLHDGLGPLLTGIGLNIDAARTHLARGLTNATVDGSVTGSVDVDPLLGRAKDATGQAIADLRGIVYGLRPPALDDLGLAGAVRTQVERLVDTSGVRAVVDVGDLPELPAAVEVAAFRIAVEAVTNVARHARARTCMVQLRVADDQVLVVTITDDGESRAPWSPGVGLLAMKERVGELGGSLTAGSSAEGGRVRACLPLLAEHPAAVPGVS